jgi:subtilisin-like proprotein convertase family protein
MRMRTIFGALLILSLVTGSAMAATIPVSGDRSSLELADQSRGGLEFHVEVGQIQTQNVATPAGDFTRLLIPGFHTSKLEGQPELPMMNRLIAVPMGAEAVVNVSNVRTRMVDLADYGITSPVFPAQPSVSKSADLDNLPFVHDAASYSKAEIRPELAAVQYQGRLRALDFARLEISPVAYYPATGQLEVVESMDVSVSFVGGNKALADDLYLSTYSPFFEHLYASIEGGKAFQDDYPDRVGDLVTMVVVTPPMFAGQLGEFVQWKTERGFNVITAVTGTPEVGSTAAEIQSYLHDLYNSATPENPAPSFVLFVGDVAQMPTFTLGGDATDRPYCAVDADLIPDMYYGRFSATNPDELQAQLDKTMMYDQYTMPDPSFLGNVTLIAGVDSGFAPTHGNGQINYGTEHYFNASHGITSNTYLYPESAGAVEGALIGTYNDGVSFVNYTAHGSTTSWSDPSLTQSNINSLTNYGKYFLAIGNCCLTSSYDLGECFGETFLRAPEKGAMGYIGGSNSTYWDEDYWFGVGYHASSQIDGSALPYEATGIGAYDGVFHDHGEADHLWYVTNDAVVFSGNLAVTESGSSRTEYYWNIYNLLGDPSISTYMGVPTENSVSHPSTIFMGQPSLTVDAEYGTYVGLTQDGVLVGAGTVDASGSLEITYNQILTPGIPVKMVAMAQNRVPYITEMMVIVPATVTIDPMVIDVNTTSDITVTIMDSEGVTPQAGINVWAEGMGYATAPVMTDASGQAVITVNYSYGPTLDIVGQDPAETYRLFTEQVTVNAMDLTSPDLTVSTDIGLSDAFALNLPGTLHATAGQTADMLFAVMPDGSVQSAPGMELTLTPGELGQVTGMIALSGYNLYTEVFDIIEAYGTLSGNVTSAGSPMANVVVNGLDEFGGTVFTAVTDANGDYAVADEQLVDTYTIVVDHFGYLHFEQEFFLGYGANVFDFQIDAAPSGILTGTVIDAVTYEPLLASVKVYRTDTGELYTETLCGEDGVFTTASLPYFDYDVRVRAWHHVPVTLTITIEEPETIKNFALEPTNGDLLLIDDTGAAGAKEAKFGGKFGDELLAEGYEPAGGKSAAQMTADLEEMGFFVQVADAASVDPATFWEYDLVILACGDNISTLSNTALKNGLVTFAQEGGHILLEGGELGYDQYGSGDFATYVMHSNDWNHDSSGNLEVADASLYILNNPNPACVPYTVSYSGYGDSDAMVPLSDATMALNWSEYPTDAGMIIYDPNPAPEGGQIVFFTFNYLAVDQGRYSLLENAVHWLLTQEVGDCSVSGQAMLMGETDHSGITVSAIPNGGSVVTGPDGTFSFPGLFAGPYQIRATKDGWATQVYDVTLESGQVITDVSLVLTPTAEAEACSAPALPITDNNTVSDLVTIDTVGTVSEVVVDVDITHTYQGDLVVSLTSPVGTEVVLHNRSGGSADNIVGTYPTTLTPAEDLGAFIGEDMIGDWTLTVSDNAGGDQGTLNSWCVTIIYDGGVVAVGAMPMEAATVAGGMGLSWDFDPAICDGFNVYRRLPGENLEKLNQQLLTSSTGHIQFVDSGEGLTAGQQVFYSYAMVIGGNELGRSEEVEVEFTSGLPTVFALHGNYPNPFNPMTTIKFDMPRQAHVKLAIYDIAGRLVKTLVDEVRPAATHTVVWDGSDRNGRRVASGTYYYVVQSDSFRAVEKMMLVK